MGMGSEAGQPNVGLLSAIVAFAIGGLLFGYYSGAVDGAQPGLNAAFSLRDAGLGFTLGSLLIACFSGALADSLGRRAVVRLVALPFLAGASRES